jgi:hypothetical protein
VRYAKVGDGRGIVLNSMYIRCMCVDICIESQRRKSSNWFVLHFFPFQMMKLHTSLIPFLTRANTNYIHTKMPLSAPSPAPSMPSSRESRKRIENKNYICKQSLFPCFVAYVLQCNKRGKCKYKAESSSRVDQKKKRQ